MTVVVDTVLIVAAAAVVVVAVAVEANVPTKRNSIFGKIFLIQILLDQIVDLISNYSAFVLHHF
jgi:hypothetical protein